jgi:F0F1-type ATP synthase membrane subunit b/b'
MLSDDVAQVQALKTELLAMKAKYADAIENAKKYQDCMVKVAQDAEYLDMFKRLTNYFLDKEGF